jgi:hypothetical protein
VQGKSLLPLISGGKQGDDPAALTMMDTYKQVSRVDARWHLIWDRQKNTAELYDYHVDPLELHDQAARQPDVSAQLLGKLRKRLSDLHFPAQ